MTDTSTPHWRWIQPIPGHPGIGGGIMAIFKAEGAAPPRDLEHVFPSQDASLSASLFAREAVANSWDAYWFSEDHEHPELEILFRFRSLDMGASRDLRRNVDLGALRDRTEAITREVAGLGSDDCLADLHGELRVLEVVERWGGGMPGNWAKGRSAMARALIDVGWAQSHRGAGGSFGYGKAAVAQGSKIYSVLAYSCFTEDAGEPGITRRLMGATYWRPHEIGEDQYNGWALFGDHTGPQARPLVNDDADAMARRLGLEARDPAVEAQLGTSFVLIDPSFDEHDLEAALLVNWWPALLRTGDRNLRLFIDTDGHEREVTVSADHRALGGFVDSYLRARAVLDGEPPTVTSTEGPIEGDVATASIPDSEFATAGALALVTTPPSPDASSSLVAYVRIPRMVVAYADFGRGEPVVRGCFIAAPEVNESLRQTEPPEHDRWLRRRGGDARGTQSDFARSRAVQKAIADITARFRRREIAEPPGDPGWMPGFSDFLAVPGQAKGRKAPPPKGPVPFEPRPKRPIHVNLVHPANHQQVVERPTRTVGERPDTLRAAGTVLYTLAGWVDADSVEAEFSIGAYVVEEAARGDKRGDPIPVTVSAPTGMTTVADGSNGTAVFRGRLARDTPLSFDVKTADYDDEWSVALVFDGSPTEPIEEVRGDGK